MSKKSCYLCGGKLFDGRCLDCGLDNAKNAKKSYRLNESYIEDRIHDLQKAGDSWDKAKVSASAGNAKMRFVLIGVIVIVTVILFGFIGTYIANDRTEAVHVSTGRIAEEVGPYEYAAYELATDGEHYGQEFVSGTYKVGVHLPEGNYRVIMEEGNGTVTVDDFGNTIYIWQDIGEDAENGELQEWSDVRLYQGARLEVTGEVRIRLVTDSAQKAKMASLQENPLREEFLLKDGQEATAGKDFPEGVYDIASISGWGRVSYSVPLKADVQDKDLDVLNLGILVSAEALDSVFHNAVLPVGTVLICEGADVRLIPSDGIESEDYGAYYDEYR